MDWQDEGLILGVRKHGETSAIVELMTANHGRHMGLVRGGRSRRMRPVLQPGNSVSVTWHARLDEHLGTYSVEGTELRASRLMASQAAVYGIGTLAAHLRLLPERDPHGSLYAAACVLVDNFEHPEISASLMIRFEIALLDELGFGLDLSACTATGATEKLTYVSPKSGCAVSQDAGQPWADKMLPLPAFLNRYEAEWGRVPQLDDLLIGFELSRFFLDRNIYVPRGMKPSDERAGFIRAIGKHTRGKSKNE